MDPNTALAEIRKIITDWNGDAQSDEAYHLLMVLTDRVEALDEWLSKGGFPPDAWKR